MKYLLIITLATLTGCAGIDKNYKLTAADKCDAYLNFVAADINGVAEQCNIIWSKENDK